MMQTLASLLYWLAPASRARRIVTGGDSYNDAMSARLDPRLDLRRVDGVEAVPLGVERLVVDSLHYADAAALRARARELLWLVHWLPSSARLGRAPTWGELTDAEREALRGERPKAGRDDGYIVPGAFMRDALLELGVPRGRIFEVEPGSRSPDEVRSRPPVGREATHGGVSRGACVELLMVANLLPAKGQLDFLHAWEALAPGLRSWRLRIVGASVADPEYAARLSRWVAAFGRGRVELMGRLAPQALEGEYARADLFISASRMESYGLALAEARARGLPICALDRGEVAHHVDARAGGVLCRDLDELARAVRALVVEPEALGWAQEKARRERRHRSWELAARELSRVLLSPTGQGASGGG